MKIKLSPVRMDEQMNANLIGDTITINGLEFDFSPLKEGDVLPTGSVNCSWILGEITRSSGEVCLTLVVPHGANAPHETRFPAAFDVPMTVVAGNVHLPPYEAEPEVIE